jgi:hypothetical protein
MRHDRAALSTWLLLSAGLCALCNVGPANPAWASEPGGSGAVAAKVIEINGAVEAQTPGQAPRALAAGDCAYPGEDVIISNGSVVTLVLPDKTLREFTGPATLALRADAGPSGGTVLGNLTAGMADILFSGKPRTLEAVMATRSADAGAYAKTSVPTLIHPAPGENLLEAPRQFTWKGVEGVPLYRVSVYSANQMMWQGTTSESEAACPAKTCDFKPGEVYYWVVEALVGNTTLRSQAAAFAVLPADSRAELARALGETDAAVADPAVATALKARLCIEARAYEQALEVLDHAIAGSPSRAAYMLRAEVNGARGLAEEALGDYRRAIAIPPGE